MGTGIFRRTCCDRTRSNGFKLRKGRFRQIQGSEFLHWGWWNTGTGFPVRWWMPWPWKYSRSGWTGLWATWSSWRCPCLLNGFWTSWPLKVASSPSHSMICWVPCLWLSELDGELATRYSRIVFCWKYSLRSMNLLAFSFWVYSYGMELLHTGNVTTFLVCLTAPSAFKSRRGVLLEVSLNELEELEGREIHTWNVCILEVYSRHCPAEEEEAGVARSHWTRVGEWDVLSSSWPKYSIFKYCINVTS